MSNEWVAPGQPSPENQSPTPNEPPHGWPPVPPPPRFATGPGSFTPGAQFRPGVIALRPQALGDIYGAVIKTIRGNLAATIGLALLTSLVFLVPATALGAWMGGQGSPDPFSPSPLGADSLAGAFSSIVPTVATAFSSIVLAGFLSYVVGQAVLGRKVGPSETWEGTKGALLRLVGGALLTGLVLVLALAVTLALPVFWLIAGVNEGGFLPIILAGLVTIIVAIAVSLFVTTRLAFLSPSLVLENLGVVAGMKRSWALTRQGFWRVLGIRLLTTILVGVIANVLTLPLGLISGAAIAIGGQLANFLIWQALIAGVTGLITSALTTPFTAGVDALLYIDARIRREGLDVALIQVTQGQASAPWPQAHA